MTSLLDRYLGTLVGVHTGDSLGAPYETWTPPKIADNLTVRGGLMFFDYPNPWAHLKDGNEGMLPAGRPTDDSEQTARLARSVLACNGIDPDHLRTELYASTYGKESVLWEGRSTGGGKTTFDALSKVPERIARARNNPIGTNGSLMRSSPMALMLALVLLDVSSEGFFDSIRMQPAKDLVYAMSDVTHAHPHSKQACWIYTLVLSSLLAGNTPESALHDVDDIDASLKDDLLAVRIGARLKDPHDLPYDPGAFPMRGTAEFSLYVALYALKHATSFAHGIEIAIRVGGDTDTYAAIAGGLLGAHFGYEAIPEDWRKAILGRDVMVDLATQMYNRFVLHP